MAMTEERRDEILLEPFFDAARRVAPVPDAAFLTLLANAGEAGAPPRRSGQRQSLRGQLSVWVGLLGGWGGVGGMATAAVVGLWIGFAGVERYVDSAETQVEADASGSVFADSDILVLAAQ